MIESYDQFNKERFLEDFKRKFNNVLKKAPIKASVRVIEPKVYLEVEGYDINPVEFTFDYSLPLKKNIFRLRELLKELTFPEISKEEVEEIALTADEMEELIKNGAMVDEALTATKSVKNSTSYKIERVIIDRDEVFLEEIKTKKRYRYRLMGISVFLYRLRERKYNPEEAGKLFFEKASFLNEIFPEKEWNDKVRKNHRSTADYVTIVNKY